MVQPFPTRLDPDLGPELAGERPAPIIIEYPDRGLRWMAPLLRWVILAEHDRMAEVVLVIHRQADRVLLAERRRHGLFALPAGGVKAGESIAAAAKREAVEETGLAVQLVGCPVVIIHQFGGRAQLYSYVVQMRDQSEGRQTPQGDEAERFHDATPDELDTLAKCWRRVREPLVGTLYGRLQAQWLEVVSQILQGEVHAR